MLNLTFVLDKKTSLEKALLKHYYINISNPAGKNTRFYHVPKYMEEVLSGYMYKSPPQTQTLFKSLVCYITISPYLNKSRSFYMSIFVNTVLCNFAFINFCRNHGREGTLCSARLLQIYMS